MSTLSPQVPTAKQHFHILDGLRGVAALSVVCFHFMEVVYSDYSKDFIGHGFLAVDFFFCLSGFVIAYAYDSRIGKMSLGSFIKARLIRLHPMVVMGSVLAIIGFIFDPIAPLGGVYGAGKTALIFLCGILMIPYPVVAERWFNLFNLNAPAWSLFWEYIANIIYALVLYRINRKWLIIPTLLAAVGICYMAKVSGNVMGGWSGGTFWDGGIRIAYSFLAGMLIFRYNIIIKNKLGFIGVAALLMLAFISPFSTWNWLTEPFIVIIYFPLIVALGAGAVLSPKLTNICIFSGDISYPLYMTHYTFIWMFANYNAKFKPTIAQLSYIIPISMLLLLGIAWLVMVAYDTPVRRYLNKKRASA
ncbi:acyltransferase family protein [Mucilaginibacter pedocola]|uniref:Acyltransferase n=1 Tax=Mucilaginibacter pedocola TaxID=1792845 RepID=A0A1S9PKE8_9SPHI|nr:acyltransferase [Mucilaginibacter pedocola]OOQ61432.1 acyltransferase [Mucilaginibacter pedocola]